MVALTIGSDSYEDQRDAQLYQFAQRESGYQNITQKSGGPASGYFQMEDSSRGGSGTWETAAAWAGLPKRPDGTYGRAMDYTEDQQWDAARALYDRRGAQPWAASAGASSAVTQLGGGSAADQANLGMGNLEHLFQQKQAQQAPIYAQMMEQYKQDKLRFDKVAENYEPIQAVQTPPAAPPNDPLKGFASIGAIFAALASGFTHTPAINAMNGMAAAINATKKGDWEQYEAGYKQWKDNVEIAIQHHKLQAEDMKNAMEMMRDNLAAGVARANVVAAQTEDEISKVLLGQGNYVKMEELRLHREEAADRMKTSAATVEKEHQDFLIKKAQMDAAEELSKTTPGTPEWNTAMQKVLALASIHSPEALVRQSGGVPGSQGFIIKQAHDKYVGEGMDDADAWARANAEYMRSKSEGKPLSKSQGVEEDARILAQAKFKELHDRDPGPGDEPEMARLRQVTRVDESGVITDDAANIVAERILAGDERASVGMARTGANMTKVTNKIAELAKQQGLSGSDIAIRIAEFQGTTAGERTLGTRAANMEIAANVVKSMAPVAMEASKKVNRTQFPTLNSVILAADRGTGGEDVVRFGQAANAIIYEYSKFLNPTGIPTDADKARATEILNTAWSSGQFAAALDQIVNKEIPAGATGIAATRREFREGLGTTLGPGGGQAKPSGSPPSWADPGQDKPAYYLDKPIWHKGGKWYFDNQSLVPGQ